MSKVSVLTACRVSVAFHQMHHPPEASIANTCWSQAWGVCDWTGRYQFRNDADIGDKCMNWSAVMFVCFCSAEIRLQRTRRRGRPGDKTHHLGTRSNYIATPGDLHPACVESTIVTPSYITHREAHCHASKILINHQTDQSQSQPIATQSPQRPTPPMTLGVTCPVSECEVCSGAPA